MDGLHVDAAVLAAELRESLPASLVPAAFVTVRDWPRTPNGKLDRAALPPSARDRVVSLPAAGVNDGSDTMRALAEIWSQLLRIPSVRPLDDFFELGGQSLLALELHYRINDRWGLSLQPMAIFQHASLGALASIVEEQLRASARARMIVPLETGGAAPPLFWIGGVTNELLSYRTVSKHLGATRPVYGIAADWTRVLEGPLTAQRIAERCVAEIRAAYPSGPYHIGGWCQAVPLALEIAAQLEDGGHPVGLVATLDYRGVESPPRSLANLPAFLENVPRWIVDDARYATWSDLWGRCRSLMRRLARRARPSPVSQPMPATELLDRLGMWRVPEQLVPMVRAHARAMRDAVLRPVKSHVVLIVPRTAPLFGPWLIETSRLRAAASRGLAVYRTPGSHSTMLHGPFAKALAERLNECLGRADAEVAR
jgi:thioesterase domain-containing protein